MPASKKARVGSPLYLASSHAPLQEITRLRADADFTRAPARRALDLGQNCYGKPVNDLMLPRVCAGEHGNHDNLKP
eukprot:9161674-Pyramimonas_sp.AAC.1